MSKKKYPFKVGELVEQVENIGNEESPLCEIIAFSKYGNGDIRVKHKHINKSIPNNTHLSDFRKIPKLRRLLMYGI